jgi:hypothetical protein
MAMRCAVLFLACLSIATGQSTPVKDPGREARRKIFRERFLDHFTLGVEAPIEWLAETRDMNGCRWDCKVLYLPGGAALPEKPYWIASPALLPKMVADARVYDYKKDGITNPAPIAGNLGHKSEYPDDDGGYMRLRAGAYYKKPHFILGKAAGKTPDPAPATPSAPKANLTAPAEALATWDGQLRAALENDLRSRRRIRFVLKALGQSVEVSSIDDKGTLTMRSDAGNFPCPWSDLTLQDRRNLALARIRDSKPNEDLCLAAFYQMACGEETAARALLKSVPPADAERVQSSFK